VGVTISSRLLAICIFGTITLGSANSAFTAPLPGTAVLVKAVPANDVVNVRWRNCRFAIAIPLGPVRLPFFFRKHRYVSQRFYRPFPVMVAPYRWRHWSWPRIPGGTETTPQDSLMTAISTSFLTRRPIMERGEMNRLI
jgi:hypothetical protein